VGDCKDEAEPARGGRFSSCAGRNVFVGSGLDPVGRVGLLFRRLAR